jgi:hypothetical protein
VSAEHQAIIGAWTCALHKSHGTAKPLRGCVHHIQPIGAGGADVDTNRIQCCETGHANVHHLMWALVNGDPTPKSARTELAMAKRGVKAWEAAGKPGSIRAFMA